MGIGVSTFLIALGAVLRFAITASVNHVNLHAIGDILMIVGVLGLITSLFLWAPRRRNAVSGTYPAGDVVEERRTVVERDSAIM